MGAEEIQHYISIHQGRNIHQPITLLYPSRFVLQLPNTNKEPCSTVPPRAHRRCSTSTPHCLYKVLFLSSLPYPFMLQKKNLKLLYIHVYSCVSVTIGSVAPFNFAKNVLFYTCVGPLLVLEYLPLNNTFNEIGTFFHQITTK